MDVTYVRVSWNVDGDFKKKSCFIFQFMPF